MYNPLTLLLSILLFPITLAGSWRIVGPQTVVVLGAVEIVHDALVALDEKGIGVDASQRGKLIGSLLTVICGDSKVQPTFAINDERV